MVGKTTLSFSKNFMFWNPEGIYNDTKKQRGNVNYFKALNISNMKLILEQLLETQYENLLINKKTNYFCNIVFWQ
jgi:hypothetical protein